MQELPGELRAAIAQYLPLRDYLSLMVTCRELREEVQTLEAPRTFFSSDLIRVFPRLLRIRGPILLSVPKRREVTPKDQDSLVENSSHPLFREYMDLLMKRRVITGERLECCIQTLRELRERLEEDLEIWFPGVPEDVRLRKRYQACNLDSSLVEFIPRLLPLLASRILAHPQSLFSIRFSRLCHITYEGSSLSVFAPIKIYKEHEDSSSWFSPFEDTPRAPSYNLYAQIPASVLDPFVTFISSLPITTLLFPFIALGEEGELRILIPNSKSPEVIDLFSKFRTLGLPLEIGNYRNLLALSPSSPIQELHFFPFEPGADTNISMSLESIPLDTRRRIQRFSGTYVISGEYVMLQMVYRENPLAGWNPEIQWTITFRSETLRRGEILDYREASCLLSEDNTQKIARILQRYPRTSFQIRGRW